MTLIASILFLAYGIIILQFSMGVQRTKTQGRPRMGYFHDFSIVVPFRNEMDKLPDLLASFEKLDFPRNKFEVLLIDDDSDDASVDIIEKFMEQHPGIHLVLLQNDQSSKAPKKQAIEKALQKAGHSWIITTDADCKFGPQWLKAFDQSIKDKNPVMIVGPVTYAPAKTALERFQLLDFLSLQGATMGSFAYTGKRSLIKPFMCNGANLAYSKEAFKKVNGFEGNRKIASGDDVFLLEKMLERYPQQVRYLKSYAALVHTSPAPDWKALLQQRVRWASKTSSYGNRFGKILGILVLLVNFLLLMMPSLALLGHFSWGIVGLLFLLKFNLDFMLLYRTALFFNQRDVLSSYFWSSLLYPVFSVLVAIWSLTGGYTWKGRDY